MIAEVVNIRNRWVLRVAEIIVAVEYTSCYEPGMEGLWSKHTMEVVAARINKAVNYH